jgi:hypothetical protein
MDDRDAIPDDATRVVIPAHLRGILRDAAERNLRKACDVAFPPDGRDDVIAAVHAIDEFEADRVPIDLVTTLLPEAIAWAQGEAVEPHTVEAVSLDEKLLKMIRELVEFRDCPSRPDGLAVPGGGAR